MKKASESMAGTPKIEDPLFQKFKNLEEAWRFFKQPDPEIHRRQPPESEGTPASTLFVDQWLSNSPRALMDFLQEIDSPPRGELRRKSWTVKRGGKIMKGRRLIDEFDAEEEICSECIDLIRGSDERSVCSSVGGSSSGFSSCDSGEEDVEKTGVVAGERTNGGTTGGVVVAGESTNGGASRWMVAKAWFAGIAIAIALGIISMMRDPWSEQEVFLVPT